MSSYKVPDLKWGKYGDFEGFYTFGPSHPPSADNNSPIDQTYLAVTCKTESPKGCPGAVNAYDQCQISVGYLQLCQTFFLTTNLLGFFLDKGLTFSPALLEVLGKCNAELKRNKNKQWRLFHNGNEVTTAKQNSNLFFGGASGKIGSWTDETKAVAAAWIAGLQETLLLPDAITLQQQFLITRIPTWVTSKAYKRLWGVGTPDREERGWTAAVRSMYLSFSANNQLIAEKNLLRLPESQNLFNEEGFVALGRSLAFSEGNPVIYPKRCGDIFPEIERIYGVNIPDNAAQLKNWETTAIKPGTNLSTLEAQKLLISLGYDLGPKGADGIFGKKSEAAVRQFQAFYGLDVTGILNTETVYALQQSHKVG